MTHLAEVHITEGIEQNADDIQMRASMLQSHLESAITAIGHVKSISQQITASMAEDGDNDCDEGDVAGDMLQKADELISRVRSAKVITNKAIRHLEDLRSRSLTLDTTVFPAIEQAQVSTSEMSLSTRTIGTSITQILNDEEQRGQLAPARLLAAVSPDSLLFSSLATKISATTTQLQNFYSITSSLTHTIEIPMPPPPPPWQMLAQRLQDEALASTSQEAEVSRLTDEVRERNAALAMRDRIIEEMTVKVEVLEKRVGESGGRREQMRDLKITLQAAQSKEKELVSTLAQMRKDLQSLEEERAQARRVPSTPINNVTNTLQGGAVNVPSSAPALAQIQVLRTEIAELQSTIRFLRRQTHANHLQSSLTFLQEPLISPQRPTQQLLQDEARDVLKEMLHLVTLPENRTVRLKVPPKDERLKWRPVKETTAWQTCAMREEWETWREWKNDVSKRAAAATRPIRQDQEKQSSGKILAKMKVRLPDIGGMNKQAGGEVKIVRPDEWDMIQHITGIHAE